MIPYVAPAITTHNVFSALTNDDIQEDLLAHAKINKKRDQNCSRLDDPGTDSRPTHGFVVIPEDHIDGNTASDLEEYENSAGEENIDEVEVMIPSNNRLERLLPLKSQKRDTIKLPGSRGKAITRGTVSQRQPRLALP